MRCLNHYCFGDVRFSAAVDVLSCCWCIEHELNWNCCLLVCDTPCIRFDGQYSHKRTSNVLLSSAQRAHSYSDSERCSNVNECVCLALQVGRHEEDMQIDVVHGVLFSAQLNYEEVVHF